MRKSSIVLCIMILLVFIVSGCCSSPEDNISGSGSDEADTGSNVKETENNVLEMLQDEIKQNGAVAGIGFIGYVDSQADEDDLHDFLAASRTGKKYTFLEDGSFVMTEGQELYGIVPKDEKGTIAVYPAYMTEDGQYADDKSEPVYIGKPGEIILLQCNLSEIYSNVLITASDGEENIDFRPSLSMEDGQVVEIPGIYEFSVYNNPAGNS